MWKQSKWYWHTEPLHRQRCVACACFLSLTLLRSVSSYPISSCIFILNFNFIFSLQPSVVLFSACVCTFIFSCRCFRCGRCRRYRRHHARLFNETHSILFRVAAESVLFLSFLLIYSVREFIRGKYMHGKVNVSEFKWRECWHI